MRRRITMAALIVLSAASAAGAAWAALFSGVSIAGVLLVATWVGVARLDAMRRPGTDPWWGAPFVAVLLVLTLYAYAQWAWEMRL